MMLGAAHAAAHVLPPLAPSGILANILAAIFLSTPVKDASMLLKAHLHFTVGF